MSSSKRQRRCEASTGPCDCIPLRGRLSDGADVLRSMAKLLCIALPDEDIDKFVAALESIRDAATDGILRFGSMCSGSGLGDLALHEFLAAVMRLRTEFTVDCQCAFLCEVDKRKADWLASLQLTDRIFKDVTTMSLDASYEWTTESMQPPPDVQVLFLGFSCKDLSSMNTSADSMTSYVLQTLEAFATNPNDKRFDPVYLQEEPLKGTTAPTLIGALQYVRKSGPEYVLMENVVGVKKIIAPLRQFLERCGYAFFCTETVEPTMFGLPNSRPRIYFGGRRRTNMQKFLDTYQHEALAVISRVAAHFSNHSPMVLEDFVLDDTASALYYLGLVGPPMQSEDSSAQEKWVMQHKQAFERIGLSRPSATQLRQFAADMLAPMSQWFLAQPLRSQEIAFFASACLPKVGPETSIDLSQSIERVNISGGNLASASAFRLPTFTAGSVNWLVRSRRFLSGRERLAMHGISPRSLIASATDAFLGDLAGNSFSATCFLVAFVSGCLP